MSETARRRRPQAVVASSRRDGSSAGAYRRHARRTRSFRRLWFAQFVSRHRRLARHRLADAAGDHALRRLVVRGRRHHDRQDHPVAGVRLVHRRARRPLRPAQAHDRVRPRARGARARAARSRTASRSSTSSCCCWRRVAVLLPGEERAHPAARRRRATSPRPTACPTRRSRRACSSASRCRARSSPASRRSCALRARGEPAGRRRARRPRSRRALLGPRAGVVPRQPHVPVLGDR